MPQLHWARRYNREQLVGDDDAALNAALMLIPLSLAHAPLAMGLLRLGFVASLLRYPVISGFSLVRVFIGFSLQTVPSFEQTSAPSQAHGCPSALGLA